MERVTAQYLERIQRNLDEIAAEKTALARWQQRSSSRRMHVGGRRTAFATVLRQLLIVLCWSAVDWAQAANHHRVIVNSLAQCWSYL